MQTQEPTHKIQLPVAGGYLSYCSCISYSPQS